MPSVTIEVRKTYNKEEGMKIMDAVHSSLQTSFNVLPSDKVVRLITHSPDKFICPPHLAKPECYTIVNIDAYSGRSIEAKRKLYQNIVKNLAPMGIPEDHILILLREAPVENWGIKE